jgi:hypothetical protein
VKGKQYARIIHIKKNLPRKLTTDSKSSWKEQKSWNGKTRDKKT